MRKTGKNSDNKMGSLYLVATPIGNLDDITYRAVEVLNKVSIIAAEDTRKSRILINRYDINTPMTSYHKFNEKESAEALLGKLLKGMDVAVISDAGTPGISDPAYEIVRKCLELEVVIIPVPGASAVIAALAASGLESDTFSFYGFFPKKKNKIIKLLNTLKFRQETLIFYESPQRILDSLQIIKDIFGNRKIVVAKEITKMYENFLRGTIDNVMEMLNEGNLKGEFVLLLSGAKKPKEMGDESVKGLLKDKIGKGMTKKTAVEMIAETYNLPKNRVYKLSLEI